jgi:hypothetical protein
MFSVTPPGLVKQRKQDEQHWVPSPSDGQHMNPRSRSHARAAAGHDGAGANHQSEPGQKAKSNKIAVAGSALPLAAGSGPGGNSTGRDVSWLHEDEDEVADEIPVHSHGLTDLNLSPLGAAQRRSSSLPPPSLAPTPPVSKVSGNFTRSAHVRLWYSCNLPHRAFYD